MRYETHPREYTLLGITGVMGKFVSAEFVRLYGGHLTEMISIIRNGRYFHVEREGERQKLIANFFRKIDAGEVDLAKEYREFDAKATAYERFLRLPSSKFNANTIKQLYQHYTDLLDIAYAASDAPDLMHLIAKPKQKKFFSWVEKTRLRAEFIYKFGEVKFMPRYLKWLQKNHFRDCAATELSCLFYQELLDYFDKNKKIPSRKELQKRHKLVFVRQYYNDKFQILIGKEASNAISWRNIFGEPVHSKELTELKGTCSYKGNVRGKVFVVHTRKDLAKFKAGGILVSPMTDPSFLPAMKKAAAFVTDEGGLLCHAAIVARELKKPCVTGTKIATIVLKDGDLVEVDANNATIKKV